MVSGLLNRDGIVTQMTFSGPSAAAAMAVRTPSRIFFQHIRIVADHLHYLTDASGNPVLPGLSPFMNFADRNSMAFSTSNRLPI